MKSHKIMSIIEKTLAVETNLFELFLTIARLSNRSVYADKSIAWVNCAPAKWPYGIFGANFETENVEEKIKSIREQIGQGNAPRLWMTGPSMRPENLDEYLVKFGFVRKSEATGMALSLSDLKADFELPSGLEIRTVTEERALNDWARVVTLGLFGRPESDVSSFYELMK
ncbi:MAG: hypothetical protein MUQ20_01905, partial [Deltaproteobacteria bacterium]|nr:hypothetical protein [Deltaproteobacteria bacterium]